MINRSFLQNSCVRMDVKLLDLSVGWMWVSFFSLAGFRPPPDSGLRRA
jgi:hypothetical protein